MIGAKNLRLNRRLLRHRAYKWGVSLQLIRFLFDVFFLLLRCCKLRIPHLINARKSRSNCACERVCIDAVVVKIIKFISFLFNLICCCCCLCLYSKRKLYVFHFPSLGCIPACSFARSLYAFLLRHDCIDRETKPCTHLSLHECFLYYAHTRTFVCSFVRMAHIQPAWLRKWCRLKLVLSFTTTKRRCTVI